MSRSRISAISRQAFLISLAALAFSAKAASDVAPEVIQRVRAITESAEYKRMVGILARDHDRIIDENIRLQQIPAPSFEEGNKAKALAALFRDAGLDTEIDEAGNVLALRRGTQSSEGVHAVVAHLDTVFSKTQDLSIKREGTRIMAPGILDDSRGLAALVAFVRAMKEANVSTRDNLLFVGSVGEEGLGDLKGVKHLFLNGKYKGRIKSMVAVDGGRPAAITAIAAGSKRYEVLFKGPGGHSFRAFGTVNPMYAMAEAIVRLSKIQTPSGTTYSVGVVGGGTSVNSIPADAWMHVDMRSTSTTDLLRLESDFRKIIDESVKQENGARSTKVGRIEVEVKLTGDRPAGSTPAESTIVQIALAASASQGWEPSVMSASTDSNLPMSLGIPAVTVASGVGDHSHSPLEYLDAEKAQSLRALQAALISVLGAANFMPGGK